MNTNVIIVNINGTPEDVSEIKLKYGKDVCKTDELGFDELLQLLQTNTEENGSGNGPKAKLAYSINTELVKNATGNALSPQYTCKMVLLNTGSNNSEIQKYQTITYNGKKDAERAICKSALDSTLSTVVTAPAEIAKIFALPADALKQAMVRLNETSDNNPQYRIIYSVDGFLKGCVCLVKINNETREYDVECVYSTADEAKHQAAFRALVNLVVSYNSLSDIVDKIPIEYRRRGHFVIPIPPLRFDTAKEYSFGDKYDIMESYFIEYKGSTPMSNTNDSTIKPLTKDLIIKYITGKIDTDGKRLGSYLSAFLNGQGGSIIFGVCDDGFICGIELDNKEIDFIEQGICNDIKDNFYPIPSENSRRLHWHKLKSQTPSTGKGLYLLEVAIQPPPGSLITYFHKDLAYMKNGNTTIKIPADHLVRRIRTATIYGVM